MIVVRRFAHCPPYSDAFIEALNQMSRERGGGYIPVEEVQKRAATITVVEPLPKLLPRLPPLLPPLPK
jgi:hypothetical protein